MRAEVSAGVSASVGARGEVGHNACGAKGRATIGRAPVGTPKTSHIAARILALALRTVVGCHRRFCRVGWRSRGAVRLVASTSGSQRAEQRFERAAVVDPGGHRIGSAATSWAVGANRRYPGDALLVRERDAGSPEPSQPPVPGRRRPPTPRCWALTVLAGEGSRSAFRARTLRRAGSVNYRRLKRLPGGSRAGGSGE